MNGLRHCGNVWLCQFHTPAERKYNKQTTPALNDLGNIIFCHSLSKIHVRIFLPADLWKNRHWGGNKDKEAVRWSECRVNTWSGVFSLSYDRWLWVISVATKVLWDGETYYCLKTLVKSFCTLWGLQEGTFLQSETVQTSLCCVRQFDSCLTAGTCYLETNDASFLRTIHSCHVVKCYEPVEQVCDNAEPPKP